LTRQAETTLAFVLRSVDYGEADRILTLFTRTRGKISTLARGARKSQKRYGGALHPFALFEATLAERKRGSLWPIQEASLVKANEGLSGDLGRLNAASYTVELIRESLLDDDPQEGLFRLMEATLALMAEAEKACLPALVIAAELEIFSQLGMAMGLSACNACGREVPRNRPVLIHPGRGGVVCTPCGGGPLTLSADTIATLQSLAEAPLTEAAKTALPRNQANAMEAAIGAFIEYHLERSLATRAYYLSSMVSSGH
jgi:DNA repair protein RecO (recombination protein O)